MPEAGDFLDATDEHTARVVAEKRLDKQKMDEQKKAKVSLDDIFSRIQEGEMKDLNIVVKADVQGTIQALEQALTNIKNTEVKVVIVHSGVGTINESDVMLAVLPMPSSLASTFVLMPMRAKRRDRTGRYPDLPRHL